MLGSLPTDLRPRGCEGSTAWSLVSSSSVCEAWIWDILWKPGLPWSRGTETNSKWLQQERKRLGFSCDDVTVLSPSATLSLLAPESRCFPPGNSSRSH